MTDVLTIHLLRANMSVPVRHNVSLTGAPTGQPGVTAIVSRQGQLGWCVLADHPRNPGVSVTNGAELYAQAVCRVLECSIDDLAWFEVDSDGCIDELRLMGPSVGFAPLHEAGCEPRSFEAFAARAAKLQGGFPALAAAEVATCLERFQRKARP